MGVVLVVIHMLVQTCFHVQILKFGVCVVGTYVEMGEGENSKWLIHQCANGRMH